jgi:hypothetical protein
MANVITFPIHLVFPKEKQICDFVLADCRPSIITYLLVGR